MNSRDFEDLVSQDPALTEPLRIAAGEMRSGTRGAFGTPLEMAAIAALFPLVTFVVKNIGLPWLHEAKRYTELWRQKFHNWVDTQYERQGLQPDAVEAAGETLRKELETLTDKGAQQSWERLAKLISEESSAD